MKCAYHPDKDAVAVCVACGTGLCADCRKKERGATYCEECLKTHEPMSVFPGREGRGINAWAVTAWVMTMIGLWPGFEFITVGGVILGFVALGDIRARGYTQTGGSYAYAAVILGVISLVAKFALALYLIKHGLEFSLWLNPFKFVS